MRREQAGNGVICRMSLVRGGWCISRCGVGWRRGCFEPLAADVQSIGRVGRARGPADGGVSRQSDAAIDAGKRCAGRLRRGQTEEGIEDLHRDRHAGPPAGADRDAGRSGRPRPGRRNGRRRAAGHWLHGRVGLSRQGLHRTDRRRSSTAYGWESSLNTWPNKASCLCPADGSR